MHGATATWLASSPPVQARSIKRQLEEVDADDAADLEQLLLSFDLAIDDLKSAYAKACEQYGGLPSYEELVNRV